eukprot:jgi/Tetstr1/458297/TSEL_000336.t1
MPTASVPSCAPSATVPAAISSPLPTSATPTALSATPVPATSATPCAPFPITSPAPHPSQPSSTPAAPTPHTTFLPAATFCHPPAAKLPASFGAKASSATINPPKQSFTVAAAAKPATIANTNSNLCVCVPWYVCRRKMKQQKQRHNREMAEKWMAKGNITAAGRHASSTA